MRKTGFSLVELLVVMAIIAILIAILIPVIVGATNRARQAQCVDNLRQLGAALAQYRQDHNVYPTGNLVPTLIGDKKLTTMLTCPKDPAGTGHDSYSPLYNYYGYQQNLAPEPITPITTNPTPAQVAQVVAPVYGPLNNLTHYYWRSNPIPGTFDSDFPGCANPGNTGTLADTIVTTCPYHNVFLTLRKSGAVTTDKAGNDPQYWTLSKKSQAP